MDVDLAYLDPLVEEYLTSQAIMSPPDISSFSEFIEGDGINPSDLWTDCLPGTPAVAVAGETVNLVGEGGVVEEGPGNPPVTKQRRRIRGGRDLIAKKLADLKLQVEQQLTHVQRLEEANEKMKTRAQVLVDLIEVRDRMHRACKSAPSVDMQAAPVVQQWNSRTFQSFYKVKLEQACAMVLNSPQDEAERDRQLEEMVNNAVDLRARLWFQNPHLACAVQDMNLEEMVLEKPELCYWRSFMDTIVLSKEQKDRMKQCHAIYVESEEKLAASRAELMAELDNAVKGTLTSTPRMEDMTNIPAALALLEKLQQSIEKARIMRLLLGGYVVMKVLRPIQTAQALIASYPYLPDPIHIVASMKGEDT